MVVFAKHLVALVQMQMLKDGVLYGCFFLILVFLGRIPAMNVPWPCISSDLRQFRTLSSFGRQELPLRLNASDSRTSM